MSKERKATKELKNAKDIVIVQADKRGKIALMDKEEYILKIEEKLRDQSFFEEVKNLTKTIKMNIMKLTRGLYKLSRINLNTKYELLSIENIPTIQDQSKLHKPNHPMRIMTCSRNTITSPLFKFIFSYIKQLRTTIKNSTTNTNSFINDITEKQIHKDEKFIYLDIEDLFTNIPVSKTIEIVIKKIGCSEKFCESALTETDLRQMLKISLKNSYIQLNKKFYRQKQGLPMGNTLSPLLADLYMQDYIEKYMKDIYEQSKFWRYVDDILIITKMNEEETID